MATFSDCPSCMGGDHAGHVRHWGKRPEGVIDGDFCACDGDCKERADKRFEDMFSIPVETPFNTGKLTLLQSLAAMERRDVITTDPDKKKCCGMDRDADGFCRNREYHPIYIELQ